MSLLPEERPLKRRSVRNEEKRPRRFASLKSLLTMGSLTRETIPILSQGCESILWMGILFRGTDRCKNMLTNSGHRSIDVAHPVVSR